VAYHDQGSGLEHPRRRHIYQHLLRLPGDHFRSIARSLSLALGTTTHHLEVLLRKGLVSVEKSNGRARYYPKGSDAETERNLLFMKHWSYRDLRFHVLFVVSRHSAIRAIEVARQLRISRQLASYHLARLEDLGLVRREGDGYRALVLVPGLTSGDPDASKPAAMVPPAEVESSRGTRKQKFASAGQGAPPRKARP